MQIKAYAKINWDLHILGRRADGFHELDSLFVNVNLFDTLTLELADDFKLSCSDLSLACDESNLVTKAARLLAATAGRNCGARIHLEKAIPMGGGMGGGSSDAAAALLGLNQLWNLNWSRERLMPLAAVLGSDVAFFLYGGWCHCRGRGEKVEALFCETAKEQPPVFPLLLIFPQLHVSTPLVYRALKYPIWDGSTGSRTLAGVKNSFQAQSKLSLRNDLTAAACQVEPQLIGLQQTLQELCPGRWLMSGSGATHFVVLKNETEGASLSQLLVKKCGSHLGIRITSTHTPELR